MSTNLDLDAERGSQLIGAASVVDVAVGQEDFLHLQAHFLDRTQDIGDVAARIDHGTRVRDGIPKQGAVLLEGRDGDDRGLEAFDGGLRGHGANWDLR